MCFVHVLYMMYAQVPPLLELCSQLSAPACISALVKSILLLLLCILKISGNHYFMKSAWDGVQCSAVQCSRGLTQHNTTQWNGMQHNSMQHNAMQHNTTQHNTTQCNTLYRERVCDSHLSANLKKMFILFRS